VIDPSKLIRGLGRDHMDRPADGVLAEHDALGTAQDFDALEIHERRPRELVAAHVDPVVKDGEVDCSSPWLTPAVPMPRMKMKLPIGLWEIVTAGNVRCEFLAPGRNAHVAEVASPPVESIEMATSCMLSARRVAVTITSSSCAWATSETVRIAAVTAAPSRPG
jgi:hypothetical protein